MPQPQDLDRANDTHRLLKFSIDVLDQALALVALHERPGAPAYASPVGAHLRHLIEHHEALLSPAEPGVVDYDRRPRDRELEHRPAVARARLEALQAGLLSLTMARLAAPLQVRGLGGLSGDFEFTVASSFGRELGFVASHAIHHFALLQAHCRQQGMPVSAEFGRAPSTVAHELAHEREHERAALTPLSKPSMPSSKETPCNA